MNDDVLDIALLSPGLTLLNSPDQVEGPGANPLSCHYYYYYYWGKGQTAIAG